MRVEDLYRTLRTHLILLLIVGTALCGYCREALAVDTYFIDRTGTFSNYGAYAYNGFTLRRTTTLVLRLVSDYNIQAAIIQKGYLNAFTSMQGYRGWAIFDKRYGTKTVTLGPGSYYVAVRAIDNGVNSYRFELDYDISSSMVPGFRYFSTPLIGSTHVNPNGGWYYHGFRIFRGDRNFLDGTNSGLRTYTIAANQLSKFKSGAQYRYFTSYSGSSGADPGLWEMNLAPGNYYLTYRNDSSIKKTVTYTMERWVRR